MTNIQIQQGPSGYGWVVVDARKSSGGSVQVGTVQVGTVQAAPQAGTTPVTPRK